METKHPQFVGHLYGTPAQPTVEHARLHLFGKGNRALEMLPPTRDALELHAARANHQAKIWLQADKEHIDVASPTETRAWKKESGGIQVVWSRLPPPHSRCLSGACDLWVQIKVQDSRMQLLSKELEVHFRVWLLSDTLLQSSWTTESYYMHLRL